MNTNFLLQLLSVSPFSVLDGAGYGVWTYQLSWSETANWRQMFGLAVESPSSLRVALELSRKIDIRSPTQYPQVIEIQSTGVDNSAPGDVQFVFRDIEGPPTSPVAFSFIAPTAQDTFSPVRLLQRPAVETPSTMLGFKVRNDGDLAFQQVIAAPSEAQKQPTPAPVVLENSTRSVLKATHVPLADPGVTGLTGRAKFSFVRQLNLEHGEVDRVMQALKGSTASQPDLHGVTDVLRKFESTPSPSLPPTVSDLFAVPVEALQFFGESLAKSRAESVAQLSGPAANQASLEASQQQLQAATMANKWLLVTRTWLPTPIGMLNLERIEMAPAGIERGGLIATIPLAPGEKTAVVQKEWSVTTKEFTSIVTDSLENYSETGVTDNTELSQSTSSQIQHGNQFNITGTVSGGIPLITGSATSTFGSQDSNSQSATDSRKHASTITQKASSRTKQEHKVTISTSTVTGTSETTTRELVNSSTTDPIRIDYFSLMRKWRVRLYRYGLRLTYDIVIPEPAGALRKQYAELDQLRAQVGPFAFTIPASSISRTNWASLAAQYEVVLPEPPDDTTEKTFKSSYSTDGSVGYEYFTVELNLPDGYAVASAVLTANQAVGNDPNTWPDPFLNLMHVGQVPDPPNPSQNQDKTAQLDFLVGLSGQQFVTYGVASSLGGVIEVAVKLQLTTDAFSAWQAQAWSALYNAAQTRYYAVQQDVAGRIATLQDRLNNVDTLTLRREESDEIMRLAIRFLLGATYQYMNPVVDQAVQQSDGYYDPATNRFVFTTDPPHGVAFTGGQVLIGDFREFLVELFGNEVRFINQAIEWENVVSFLYSYFWDMPESWNFIRNIQHPDATRQAFLRAGSARVVLTVRKGWEDLWLRFVDGIPPGQTTPRLTIAQEIAAYDERNYPGIPPANPGGGAVRLQDSVYTTSSTQLPVPGSSLPLSNVEILVESSAGFVVGARVRIDTGVHSDPTNTFGWWEETTVNAVRDQHITLAGVSYQHGGDEAAYVVLQPGEKGVLIAEWNEYTPTSGTDIAVTSNLTTIT